MYLAVEQEGLERFAAVVHTIQDPLLLHHVIWVDSPFFLALVCEERLSSASHVNLPTGIGFYQPFGSINN